MPSFGDYDSNRSKRAEEIRKKLLARGLDPRSNGFYRAFYKAMRK